MNKRREIKRRTSTDGFGLSEVLHGEGADLVEAHHLGHGREHYDGVKLVTKRLHHLHHLFGKLLHKDKRADEDICRGHISLEATKVALVAELLEEVAHNLDAYALVIVVD